MGQQIAQANLRSGRTVTANSIPMGAYEPAAEHSKTVGHERHWQCVGAVKLIDDCRNEDGMRCRTVVTQLVCSGLILSLTPAG
jgi:hypothetical protein